MSWSFHSHWIHQLLQHLNKIFVTWRNQRPTHHSLTPSRWQWCWWLYDGESFKMLVLESLCCWHFLWNISHQHLKLSSTSVTNIDVTIPRYRYFAFWKISAQLKRFLFVSNHYLLMMILCNRFRVRLPRKNHPRIICSRDNSNFS